MWAWIGRIGKHVSRAIAVALLAMAVMAFAPDPVGLWSYNFWVSVDQFGNALTFGDPDETISSRMGKWSTHEDVGLLRRIMGGTVCFFLDLVDANHCENSIDRTEGKDAVIR